MNDIEVEVRLSHYTNSRDGGGAHLEITDKTGYTRLITVELSPEQVYKLISSQGAVGTANVLSPEHYAQRVGKVYIHERVKLTEEFEKSIRMEREVTEAMRNLGEIEKRKGGYEGYSWSLHNYGWSLTLWKYEAPDE